MICIVLYLQQLHLGGSKSLPADTHHFTFKMWLSHDDVLDAAEDVDLQYDTSTYDALSNEYASSGVFNLILETVGGNELVSEYRSPCFR